MASDKDSVKVELGSPIFRAVTIDVVEGVALPPPPYLTPAQESKLWRKMDLRLLPILAFIYLMAFMDRANISNAKLEGLITQLHLKGDEFNVALLVFFIPYILFETPANLMLRRFRPSRWLGFLVTSLGITMILMGFTKLYFILVASRFMLGLFEAGLFPGMAYYLTFWYPRDMLQLRIGFFYGSASLAGAFSGILAYGIHSMSGLGGLLGWSWIFILEGIATLIVGVTTSFVVVDSPATAKFLMPEERSYVIHRKELETSGVGEEGHFEARHFWDVLTDWQVWLQILILISAGTPLYGITFFLPSIINDFGFSTAASQLLTVPPYVFGTIVVYLNAYYSDKLKKRSPFIFGGLLAASFGLLMNILNLPVIVKYIGTFAIVAGTYSSIPGIVSWLGNNLSGQYKRCIGMALHIGLGNLCGIFASLIYRTQDAPRYHLGHAMSAMFVTIGLITVPITVFMYRRINRQRDQILQELHERGEQLSPAEIKSLGDRAPTFRYMI